MLAAKLFTQHWMLSVHGERSASRVQRAFAAAGGRLDSIRLRQVSICSQAIGFDQVMDVPTVKTLQLALNADSEYAGGRLVFATFRKNSQGSVMMNVAFGKEFTGFIQSRISKH